MIFSNSDYDIQAKCNNRYLVIFRQKEYRIYQDDDGDYSLIARISNIVERDTALNILKIIQVSNRYLYILLSSIY